MFEAMVNDVLSVFRATFLQDGVSLAIAFGSALVASLLMNRGGQAGSMTLLALTLFAGAGLMRSYLRGGAAEVGPVRRAIGQLEAGWARLMDMSAGTLIAYFIAFMVMIFLFFGVRSAIAAGSGGGHH